MVAGQFDAFMVLVSRVICLPYPINYHIYLQKLSLSFKQFIIEILSFLRINCYQMGLML